MAILMDYDYPDNLKARHIIEIEEILDTLQGQHTIIIPFVTNIREHISGITEETTVCGIYLTLCTILKTWDSISLLAQYWHYSSIMTLLRVIEEANMQCNLFVSDLQESKNINDWFAGNIIEHKKWREKMDKLINHNEINLYSMETYMYQIHSQFPHNGYLWILENVSPFTEDFDFEWPVGYYKTISALKNLASHYMTTCVITLKAIYLFVIKDQQVFDELDEILKKDNPDIGRTDISNSIKVKFKKS